MESVKPETVLPQFAPLLFDLFKITVDGKPLSDGAKIVYELAQTTGIVVVALAQLNRDSTKSGQNPTNADLRESGQIEQDADAIILLSSDKITGEDSDPRDYVFLLSKNKEGRCCKPRIMFNPQIQRFEEYEW